MSNLLFWQESVGFPILSLLGFLPLFSGGVLFLLRPSLRLELAIGVACFNLAVCAYLLMSFVTDSSSIQMVEACDVGGFEYRVGVDGTNVLFLPLTALLGLLALIYTSITRHKNDSVFIACLLVYQGVLMEAFVALNTLQFWFWSAMEVIPVMILTLSAGTGVLRNRVIRIVLQYWLSGLLMSLAGFLLLSFGLQTGAQDLSFDWIFLRQHDLPIQHESLIFILLMFAFSIRMPLFPFHAWLPVLAEHGTAASVAIFITGLKLGIYAVIRFILPLVPAAAEQWELLVVSLGLIAIFYGALLALMQINIRRLMAFAVVSQTGMLIIGVFSFNDFALEGSILLSVAYGLATAGMLFSIGLIYERTRTSYLPRLGALFDTNTTIALLFMMSALSTMVMPGTPGFDAAHLLIEGSIEEHGWLIAIAILLGNVVAAGFLLWAFQRLFITQQRRAIRPSGSIDHPVIQERIIAVVICGILLATGFYTTPWLRFIDQEASEIGERYVRHHSSHSNGGLHEL